MEASILPENGYATTVFELREPQILPHLGIAFGSSCVSFAVAESFLQLLETFTEMRSSSAASRNKVTPFTDKRSSPAVLRHKVHAFFRMLDLEWPITPQNLWTTKN